MSEEPKTSAANPVGGSSIFAQLAPLVAIVFFGFLSVGLPLPALPRHVHDTLGYGPIIVGWAVGLQSIVTVLTRGVGGAIVDSRGPKAAVMVGLPFAVAAGATYVVSAWYAGQPLLSLAVLLLGRVLLGVSESVFLVGTMTWGMVRAGPANTGRVMAWQGIALYAALGLGAPIGLALQQSVGFMAVGVAVIVAPIVGLLVALRLQRSAPRAPGGGPRVSFFRVLGMIWPQGLGLGLGTAPFAAMAAFLALHFADRDWGGAGLALSGFAAGYIGIRLLFGHLPDRPGGGRVLILSLAVETAGQLILWSATSELLAIVGAVATGVGFSLVFPAFGVQAMRRAPPEVRGLAVGGYIAFFDIALGLTGPVSGAIAGQFGFASVFLVGAACTAVGMVVAVLTGRQAPAAG